MSTKTAIRHPVWCTRVHDKHDGHESADVVYDGLRWQRTPIHTDLVDIGTVAQPNPVIRTGWGDNALLTPTEARQYGLELIRLAALAES